MPPRGGLGGHAVQVPRRSLRMPRALSAQGALPRETNAHARVGPESSGKLGGAARSKGDARNGLLQRLENDPTLGTQC